MDQQPVTLHPATVACVQALRQRYPDVPFLTLGQTVLWDEPLKAAFCRILEDLAPHATMVGAIHDTDYFAKLPHLEEREGKFVMLPHDDGLTRGLWSAAGELSCLFGSETVPTRQLLSEAGGVSFDRVARDYPGGMDALLREETRAWGWRALVHTEPGPLIAADVRLADIAPALLQQLHWGFDNSLESLVDRGLDEPPHGTGFVPPATPAGVSKLLLHWVEKYLTEHPDDTLSQLYRWLTPRLWVLVRGTGSCNLTTDHSLGLFAFNSQTASRRRFEFVDLFLQPKTREVARRCYDDAVRGSGIYTLDQFGPGALPFDLVIPGRGRGTLRLHDQSLYIETESPITLCTGCDCSSVQQLADVLQEKFGEGVALVGKAVALISMLAHEFIFVFHEKASGYTVRTQVMNQSLRDAGIALHLHPLLRLKYSTWDALGASSAELQLPPHLARAFRQPRISGAEFGRRWEEVCTEQEGFLKALRSCRSPREMMGLLASREPGQWPAKLEEYHQARAAIAALRDRTRVLEGEVEALRQQARELKQQASALEREKGEDFRRTVQPLRKQLYDIKEGAAVRQAARPLRQTKAEKQEEASLENAESARLQELRQAISSRQQQRAHYDEAINSLRRSAHEAQSQAGSRSLERVKLERSTHAATARRALNLIEYEVELERLRRARDAITTTRGLRYTNYRPAAWWLPLVSPDGAWFQELVRTAEARLEEL